MADKQTQQRDTQSEPQKEIQKEPQNEIQNEPQKEIQNDTQKVTRKGTGKKPRNNTRNNTRKRREEARKRRERQLRNRKILLAVFLVAAVGIISAALAVHIRNVREEKAAAAASRKVMEEAAAEASRKKAEEAAAEASRKEAEEAAAEASRKEAEEAAAEASRKKAEEAAAGTGAQGGAEKAPQPAADYNFKAAENTAEVPEEVESSYAVLVDLETGTVVAGREYDTIMNPASMTKILTLLVAVENIDLSRLDTDTIEITQEITDYVFTNQMSQVGWNIGDTPTVRSLLYGTILPSGADAALGLAIYTAGSEEAFVELMNKKLADLGISDTAHFTNVVGAYDEDHYCTALDMATILRAAIDNELCREVLSCHYYEVPPSGGEDSESIGISNWFLRRIEDKDTHGTVVCAKTGYVGEAGFCAASYQESDNGGRYICVTADGSGIWPCIYDHVDLYTAFTE